MHERPSAACGATGGVRRDWRRSARRPGSRSPPSSRRCVRSRSPATGSRPPCRSCARWPSDGGVGRRAGPRDRGGARRRGGLSRGLRPARGRASPRPWTATRCSRSPRCRSRSRRRWWRRWSARASSTGGRASPTSTRPSRSTTPIRPRRSRCATSSTTAAACPAPAGDDLEDDRLRPRRRSMHRLRLVPPSSSFRAGYAYSNAGLTVGALAAAVPTGKIWEDVAEEQLFEPLGMASTSSRHADFLARANAAALHVGGRRQAGTAKVKRDATAQAPAGGVSSSGARSGAMDAARARQRQASSGEQLIARRRAGRDARAADGARRQSGHRRRRRSTGSAGTSSSAATALAWGHAGAFSVGARTLVTLYPEQPARHRGAGQRLPDRRAGGRSPTASSTSSSTARSRRTASRAGTRVYGGMFGPAIEAAEGDLRRSRPSPRPRRCRPPPMSGPTPTTMSAPPTVSAGRRRAGAGGRARRQARPTR